MKDPLTGRTTRARGMVVSLLKYANREKVAQALTERGYPVTRMSVNRWARGNEMPEIAARMIAQLFGHHPDTTKEPPPWWTEAQSTLVDEIRLNREAIATATGGLVTAELRKMMDDALAKITQQQPQPAEDRSPNDSTPDGVVGDRR